MTNQKTSSNTVYLMAKQYLYKCKCEETLPNIDNFKHEIYYTKSMEK